MPLAEAKGRLYHVKNGNAFAAEFRQQVPGPSLTEYKAAVRKAYGSLRGVKFVLARNRAEALWKAAQTFN